MSTPEFVTSEKSAGDGRKRLVVAGGVAAALVLGYGGYHLLSGGNASSEQAFVPIRHTPIVKAKVVPAKAKPVAAKAVSVPAPSTVKLGRDPFLALYTVPAAVAPATTATGSTTTSTTTGPSSGSTTGAGTTGTSAPYALKLMSIKGTDAKFFTFAVDTSAKTVVTAQKFGKYGELVVLAYIKDSKGAPIGALIQVGDDDPTAVKVGEKITVQ
jgi:hypothetical protein